MRKLNINRKELYANIVRLLATINPETKEMVRLDLTGDFPLVSVSEQPPCNFDYYLGAAFVPINSQVLFDEDEKEIALMDTSARANWLFGHFEDIMSEIEKGQLEDGYLNFVDDRRQTPLPALAWCDSVEN